MGLAKLTDRIRSRGIVASQGHPSETVGHANILQQAFKHELASATGTVRTCGWPSEIGTTRGKQYVMQVWAA